MRIIPTNRFLLKCNIGHTTLCDFCCMEIETLDHQFWECIHVQLFWINLSTLLQDYNVFIHFNLRNIMLGITEGTNQTEVQTKNFIISLSLTVLHTLENNIFLTIPRCFIAPFSAYLVILFALFSFSLFFSFI